MLQAGYQKYRLFFKFKAGTSRGSMTFRDVYYIYLWEDQDPGKIGIGEAAPLKGLSTDLFLNNEKIIDQVINPINKQEIRIASLDEYIEQHPDIQRNPSLKFALEAAFKDLQLGGKRQYFNSFKKEKIKINGLIWMADESSMRQQAEEKTADFSCIKMKIGAIHFEKEYAILEYLRSEKSNLVLRADANGAFSYEEALNKLQQLSSLNLHSVEQPIAAGQWKEMKQLCKESPIPIALDEELIGVSDKEALLDEIQPQYIVLKPSLLGGFEETKAWIRFAEARNIGWWITSALESNIGLNAISQFTAQFDVKSAQGLGTGSLFHNNVLPELPRKGEWISIPRFY